MYIELDKTMMYIEQDKTGMYIEHVHRFLSMMVQNIEPFTEATVFGGCSTYFDLVIILNWGYLCSSDTTTLKLISGRRVESDLKH